MLAAACAIQLPSDRVDVRLLPAVVNRNRDVLLRRRSRQHEGYVHARSVKDVGT